jgi:putative redox protein
MTTTVTVHGGAAGLKQEILVGKHRAVADEPLDGGGADAGPTPYDYLLAALGA